MRDEDLEKVKEKVLKKLKRINSEIEHLIEITKPIAPENSLGRITRMDAINSKSVNEATLRQARSTHNKLEYALQRIEQKDPKFGMCSNCDEEIPLPRVMLMPESDKCVKCAR